MAHIDKHAPGSFCWFELGTTDQAAAKTFYTSLFGWQVADMPMGPDSFYSMFQLEGRNAGAAYTLTADMRAKGVPPNWMLYIVVESADETAAKITAAGGTLLAPPFDVPGVGRMAPAKDPAGAAFCIFQPGLHPGVGINAVPGTVCWADLNTTKLDSAVPFYRQVFGWEFAVDDGDKSGYLHIKNGGALIGGAPPAHMLPPNVPSHWLLYFYVADTDASTAKAVELGGRVWKGPISLEKVGRMSILSDPQGAAFALFQPFAM